MRHNVKKIVMTLALAVATFTFFSQPVSVWANNPQVSNMTTFNTQSSSQAYTSSLNGSPIRVFGSEVNSLYVPCKDILEAMKYTRVAGNGETVFTSNNSSIVVNWSTGSIKADGIVLEGMKSHQISQEICFKLSDLNRLTNLDVSIDSTSNTIVFSTKSSLLTIVNSSSSFPITDYSFSGNDLLVTKDTLYKSLPSYQFTDSDDSITATNRLTGSVKAINNNTVKVGDKYNLSEICSLLDIMTNATKDGESVTLTIVDSTLDELNAEKASADMKYKLATTKVLETGDFKTDLLSHINTHRQANNLSTLSVINTTDTTTRTPIHSMSFSGTNGVSASKLVTTLMNSSVHRDNLMRADLDSIFISTTSTNLEIAVYSSTPAPTTTASTTPTTPSSSGIRILVDGTEASFANHPPFTKDGVVYVHTQSLLQALGDNRSPSAFSGTRDIDGELYLSVNDIESRLGFKIAKQDNPLVFNILKSGDPEIAGKSNQSSTLPDGAIYYEDTNGIMRGKIDIPGTGKSIYLGETKESIESKFGSPVSSRRVSNPSGIDGLETHYSYSFDNLDLVYTRTGRLSIVFITRSDIDVNGHRVGNSWDESNLKSNTNETIVNAFGATGDQINGRFRSKSELPEEVNMTYRIISNQGKMTWEGRDDATHVKTIMVQLSGRQGNSWAHQYQ